MNIRKAAYVWLCCEYKKDQSVGESWWEFACDSSPFLTWVIQDIKTTLGVLTESQHSSLFPLRIILYA